MSNSDPTLFERLAKVEPAKLARLLVELAEQDQTILEQVQLLLASGDTAAIAKAVRSTLRAWKRSLRFIHYQEAFAFGEQLDRLLDSMEDGLLGPDPALTLDLLEEFLQSDRWILERVDDSAGCIGTAYRRACQLCPAPRFFVGTGQVQRRIISWELARGVRGNLAREEL